MNGTVRNQCHKRPPLIPPNRRGTTFSPFRWQNKRGASHPVMILWITLFLFAFLFVGCTEASETPPPVAQERAITAPKTLSTPQPTETHTPIPTITHTSSPTATSTPTPTPTATAVPAKLVGDPHAGRLTDEPEPRGGAPCGVVDIFDFPIGPPDGIGVNRGGGDFGQFRSRYDKYHAGEDWGGVGGGSSFGEPVYSIGHGRVMYAQPEGWNRDKGVVIIEHIVGPEKQILYSFYGHLDPPTVLLEPGTCIKRGEHVGNIGQPRTPPHLHFEIRIHMPYAPGPGYWEEDPTTAGWLPPSQTIWNQRMASSPGVVWLRTTTPNAQPIGLWRDNSFLTLENGRLIQTNIEAGNSQPSTIVGKEINSALLHPQTNTLFLHLEDDTLIAFAQSKLWQVEVEVRNRSTLLPLPNGGVMIVQSDSSTGLSADGEILWQIEMAKRPFAWTLSNNALIITISGSERSTWRVTDTQGPVQLTEIMGIPMTTEETNWLYAPDGLYQLTTEGIVQIQELPSAKLNFSDMTPLPDGSLLLFHTDNADRRLLRINQDGSIHWNVSVAGLVQGKPTLATVGNQVLLFTEGSDGNNLQTNLYAINPDTGDLTHIFNGGTRPFVWDDTWITSVGSHLLFNSGGGAVLLLDPQQARTAIAYPPN